MTQGFTKYPNNVIDHYMKNTSDAAYKILSVVIRQTIGWQKETDIISLSQFEVKTGKSRMTVVRALRELIEKDMIEVCGKTRDGKAYRVKQIKCDELSDTILNYSNDFTGLMSKPVKRIDLSSKEYVSSEVKKLDTQKDTQYKIENNKKNVWLDDLDIPQNIDRGLLNDFIAMRAENNKHLNYRAANLILKQLEDLGNLANDALRRAIIGGYMNIFNPNMTRAYGKQVNSAKSYSSMKSRRF